MFRVPQMWTTWESELPTCVKGRGVELMFHAPKMLTTLEGKLPTCVEGRGVELMFLVPQMLTTWESELPTCVEGRGVELMFLVPQMLTTWEGWATYLCGRTRCWADVPCSPDMNNVVHCTHHREGWPAAHHSTNFVLKNKLLAECRSVTIHRIKHGKGRK
jgi:hypothetical protein